MTLKFLPSYAGFDLVTLANNHMNDYGEDPVNFTVQSFKNVGIKAFGINYGPTDSPQVGKLAPRAHNLSDTRSEIDGQRWLGGSWVLKVIAHA